MKDKKFVVVTGACMFLLLLMIVFNFGGPKSTYSATYGCQSGYSLNQEGTCCKDGYVLENGKCCPSSHPYYGSGWTYLNVGCYKVQYKWGYTVSNGNCVNSSGDIIASDCYSSDYHDPVNTVLLTGSSSSGNAASSSNGASSSAASSSSTTTSGPNCFGGSVSSDGTECASCGNGYACQRTGVSPNIKWVCIADSSSTGITQCGSSSSSSSSSSSTTCPAGQVWNSNKNACIDSGQLGCEVTGGTWNTTTKKCSCPTNYEWSTEKNQCIGKKTPNISTTWSSQTIKVGEKITLQVSADVSGRYYMTGSNNAAGSMTQIEVPAGETITVDFIGKYVGTDNITIQFSPSSSSSGYTSTSKNITIKVVSADSKVDPKLNITYADKMAVGETARVILTSNVKGTFNLSLDTVNIINLSGDEFEVNNNAATPTVTARKVGTVTITVKFTPDSSISSSYNTMTETLTITVADDGNGACYKCSSKNSLTKWATSLPAKDDYCTTYWTKDTSISYADCNDYKCYKCVSTKTYRWTTESLSLVDCATDDDWYYLSKITDEDSCNASGDNDGSDYTGGDDDYTGGGDTPGGNNSTGGNNNTTNNPQTGNIMLFVVWIIGFGVIGYSFWYFKNLNKNGA